MFVGPDVNWDVVHVCQGCSHSATHNPILCQNPEFAISQTGSPQLHLDSDNFHEKSKLAKFIMKLFSDSNHILAGHIGYKTP